MEFEKDIRQSSEGNKIIKNTESAGVLDKDNLFVLMFKKTEKLVSALYLVTNLFPDQEPMKWNLRKLSFDLLELNLSLKDNFYIKTEIRKKIESLVIEIISLLQICYCSGMVSEMNHSILNGEFNLFLNQISKADFESKRSVIFPENFFEQENKGLEDYNSNEVIKDTLKTKGQFNNGPALTDKKTFASKETSSAYNPEIKKNSRTGIILDLVKKHGQVMIKDVSVLIRDCSEKTIQRELLSLVKQGVLKKEGERRWSKYSLA